MKRVLIVLWLLLCVTIFVRPGFYGFDPYYYLSLSCGLEKFPDALAVAKSGDLSVLTFAREFFWPVLPCSELFMKSLLCVSIGLVFLFGYLVGKELGVGAFYFLVLGLFPFFFSSFSKLEDSGFGFVFVFCSLWLLLRFKNCRDWKWFFASLVVCVVGGLFWRGMIVWLIIVLLSEPVTVAVGFVVLFLFGQTLFSFSAGVSENVLWVGLLGSVLLWVGVFKLHLRWWLSLAFAGVLAFFSLKLSVFFVLLLGVGCCLWLKERNFFKDDLKIVLGVNRHEWLIGLLIIFSLVGIVGLYFGMPDARMQGIVKEAVVLADGNVIQNEWSFGHMIWYYGGKPNKDSGPPNFPFDENVGVKLTIVDLNCRVVDWVKLQDENLRLYKC